MSSKSVAELPWFVDMIKREENAKESGSTGNGWTTHESKEGGLDTIGYGHKLVPSDKSIKILDGTFNLFTDIVPNKYIEALTLIDIRRKEKLAAKQFATHSPFKGKWDDLPPIYRAIMTEINYNAGLVKNGKWAWPTLAKNMEAGNMSGILGELGRTFTDKNGVKQPLTSRVNRMIKDYRPHVAEHIKGSPKGKFESGIQRIHDQMTKSLDSFGSMKNDTKIKLIMAQVRKEEEEEQKRQEQVKEYSDFYHTINLQADEQDRLELDNSTLPETLGNNKEAEATLMEEVEIEMRRIAGEENERFRESMANSAPPTDGGHVEVEELSKVQYYQRDDGKVIKTNENGDILDD